jgi:RNA methyltransferase, TrmH family
MITSRDNEKLKLVRKLHERRWRDKLGLFFIEGEDAVAAATADPVELLVAGENVLPELLAEVGTAAHPPRVIAVYRREDLPAAQARPVTLALFGVADPGNVGTLVRTADGFGAAVALSAGCADPTGPKALRASAGSIWRVPLLPGDHVSVLTHEHGKRVALVAHGGEPLAEVDLRGEVVFLLGAERAGLPAEVERDVEARIPIDGAESLNVAAAGSIALYEWRRQNPSL